MSIPRAEVKHAEIDRDRADTQVAILLAGGAVIRSFGLDTTEAHSLITAVKKLIGKEKMRV